MENPKPARKLGQAYIRVNIISLILSIISLPFVDILGAIAVFWVSIHLVSYTIYRMGQKNLSINEMIHRIVTDILGQFLIEWMPENLWTHRKNSG